ncbi:MAG: sel1 repeat family protein [Elusimicrobia bacterium]|nr:sel1 repeat family protein [Elusimicrobiota bacterium]
MEKKILTAEDCNELAKQNDSNEKENKFWKTLSKLAIKQKDKEVRDEQEKKDTLKCFTDEGKSGKSKAIEGDSEAQFLIALSAYDNENFKEAFRWFWLSAQNGHAEAADYLSIMYADGEYVSVNYALSLQWCRIAANRGSQDAKETLEDIKKIHLN